LEIVIEVSFKTRRNSPNRLVHYQGMEFNVMFDMMWESQRQELIEVARQVQRNQPVGSPFYSFLERLIEHTKEAESLSAVRDFACHDKELLKDSIEAARQHCGLK
jgi:hypothetical protein